MHYIDFVLYSFYKYLGVAFLHLEKNYLVFIYDMFLNNKMTSIPIQMVECKSCYLFFNNLQRT